MEEKMVKLELDDALTKDKQKKIIVDGKVIFEFYLVSF